MKSESTYCHGCEDWIEFNPEVDEDPILFCQFCEQTFCWKHFSRHECEGHKPESLPCFNCDDEIYLDSEKPVYIDGDSYHFGCLSSQRGVSGAPTILS